MRSGIRKSVMAGARDVAPIVLGIVPWGLVAGAIVAALGFGVVEALGMSAGVFAGAAQLAATTLFAEAAPLWVIIGTALVINARYVIYSSSIAPVVAPEAGRLRGLAGYILTDQSYAVTMTEGRHREDISIVPYYLGASFLLWAVWQVTNVVGVLAGSLVPESWSLEFAVPLVFLALLVPAIEGRVDVEVVFVSAVAATVLEPLLPVETGLLAAIVIGLVWGAVRDRRPAGEGPS